MSIAEIAGRDADFERTPPHDMTAEQCVLGGMLLSKDAISDVVEILRADDFYRPAHQIVFEAIMDLYARGEPVDAVTIGAELTKRGELQRTGGAPYLHTLISSVPTAANAGYYAQIVAERAVLRRLIEAGTRIVQLGYSVDGEVEQAVDQAQAEIYRATESRTSDDFAPLSDIMPAALDELEAIGSSGGQMVGVPTGFADLDALMNGLHPGQLIVVAARPAIGKSTLGLDFVRAAAIKHNLTSVIFSLEMSRNEITMRLLSAEARVPMHTMRSGLMTDDDWTRLARRMSEVAEAPFFIDDSPNMSMMEIRSKCRRLKQRHDLRLVIIDYLQLMTSGKRVESRQVEVSEFSRSLKLLAKELEVPVIAISQLNRGPEQRTDKKPMLSDLRESGCVTASTRVLRADTNAEVSIAELHATGATNVPVWALDEQLRLVPHVMSHVFATGRKEVFRVRLRSGKEIEATAGHPFLTVNGWARLGDLGPGSRVGVPRRIPNPSVSQTMDDDELVSLARLLGDGSFGARSHEKSLPERLFGLAESKIAHFLRHLWATDGSVALSASGGGRISYASTSRPLLDGVSRLLARFGIGCRIATATARAAGRPQYTLDIPGRDDQLLFLERIGVHGAPAANATALTVRLRDLKADADIDTIPREVWERVRVVLQEQRVSQRPFAAAIGTTYRGTTLRRQAPSRGRLAMIAEVLGGEDLDVLATNDVFWDEISECVSLGVQDVYDATVPGVHNFVANGVSIHNSIEQDADVVILLHREDAYERESPRAGEADLVVAKHRNGPTATVTVAFQGHYSRFVDMAPG